LVQDHGNGLPACVAFEVDVRVENREKKNLSLYTRADLHCGQPSDLCFEMIALPAR
jgi:hypothetical protein